MTELDLTVLVVEDDPTVRESFCDYLEDHGLRPLAAASGEAALQLLHSEHPRAAVVDIRMAEMNGDDFIRKGYEQDASCVFIICTGSREYCLPRQFKMLNRISPMVFQKPLEDLSLLHKEIVRMLAGTQGGSVPKV